MLCIPSLSSSYFASDHQVEDLDKNLVGIVRDVEMVERELHSVVATLSDLASKLSQLKVKTKELAAGCSNQELERGKNPVCLLQELMVANNSIKHPTYHLVGEFGPGHSKIFQVINCFYSS